MSTNHPNFFIKSTSPMLILNTKYNPLLLLLLKIDNLSLLTCTLPYLAFRSISNSLIQEFTSYHDPNINKNKYSLSLKIVNMEISETIFTMSSKCSHDVVMRLYRIFNHINNGNSKNIFLKAKYDLDEFQFNKNLIIYSTKSFKNVFENDKNVVTSYLFDNNDKLNDEGYIDTKDIPSFYISIHNDSTRNNETCIKNLLEDIKSGLNSRIPPTIPNNGTSGSYLLQNGNHKSCAIFKPYDEEPYTPNNPCDFVDKIGSPGVKYGLYSGQGAIREVAAYRLDYDGFFHVPPTFMAKIQHKNDCLKIGSLQKMIKHVDLSENYGPSKFDVKDVHRIGILDIHLVNLDRNGSNILVDFDENGRSDLIPIDHGCCLPSTLTIKDNEWVWMDWPQSRMPFSQKSMDFIKNIDIKRDIEIIKKLNISEDSIRVFILINMFLKKSAEVGLTLFEIGNIIQRLNFDSPSKLEFVNYQALKLTKIFLQQRISSNPQYKILQPNVISNGNSINNELNLISASNYHTENGIINRSVSLNDLIPQNSKENIRDMCNYEDLPNKYKNKYHYLEISSKRNQTYFMKEFFILFYEIYFLYIDTMMDGFLNYYIKRKNLKSKINILMKNKSPIIKYYVNNTMLRLITIKYGCGVLCLNEIPPVI